MSRCDWHRPPDDPWFYAEVQKIRLRNLGHNLAVAGALCASFAEGWDQCELWRYHALGYRLASMWRPGCELPGTK